MIKMFDGAMGTMLQQAGLQPGACPEILNIEKPEAITTIHQQYIAFGADIIETNTFGANRIKLSHYGLADKVNQINTAGVTAARQAAGKDTKIAGSVGPTGRLIFPLGDLSFDQAVEVYTEQINALATAGVDFIIIETIIDIQEMRAALLAAKTASATPVICQLSFGEDGRTVTGTDPKTAAVMLEAMGADIIGANCSLGPAQLLPIVTALAESCHCPISVQPNAGMPRLINGKTEFPMTPADLAAWAPKLAAAGASYIGGCCGTTPQHIKEMRQSLKGVLPPQYKNTPIIKYTALTSRSKTIYIGQGLPTAIIGERINPTGRKILSNDIQSHQFITVKKEALEQLKAGASILDVNMGVPGIDQPTVMKQAIEELSMLVDSPLSIDTSDPAALEAGLKAYPGRALINSVSAEPERLAKFLPLAKKYGAAILCLPISPDGIPASAEERVNVIREIIHAALAEGLRPQDFVLDALVLTVAADKAAAAETIATLKLYRKVFGYPTTMGLSNISYGLPLRERINSTFCAMALASGLDAPILNPYNSAMQEALSAAAVLLGHDANGRNYSRSYGNTEQISNHNPIEKKENILAEIRDTVIHGEKAAVIPLVRKAIEQGYPANDITQQGLTEAMNEIGQSFGAGRCFLPQVLLSAETMRAAFQTIKEILPAQKSTSAGKIVLATVKGDIHDLGKNIVAALLENSGFEVIDLGKDVAAEKIVAAATSHQADIVGLCALMTTTLPQIDCTIKQLKAAGSKARTLVGGAVLTPEYALQAGADAYAANGVEAVTIAKQLKARADS